MPQSNFDPKSPAYVPPGVILADDGTTFNYIEGNQTATAVIASSTISANTAVAVDNLGCRGALFVLDITGFPGSLSTSVALKLNMTSPRTATFASRAALSASGVAVFMVYPGISASAGGVSCPLPRNFSVKLSLSTGATSKDVTLSLNMLRIK